MASTKDGSEIKHKHPCKTDYTKKQRRKNKKQQILK